MYLPDEIPDANVLITVKAYPKPSSKYEELVCTAGYLDGEKWIRIYPVPYRYLTNNQRYPKYSWVRADLVRNTKDFRPESYRPKQGLDVEFKVGDHLGTRDAWAARKSFVLNEVFDSMGDLIRRAHADECKSLATMAPKEIIDFKIEETDREWKKKWTDQAQQASIFDLLNSGEAIKRDLIPKVPFDYFYEFTTEGDTSPRKLKIEDWEIGALFWNCLQQTHGDEVEANNLVRNKYYDDFVSRKDLLLFLGTTLRFHKIGSNPFMIIGVFYPPKSSQPQLL